MLDAAPRCLPARFERKLGSEEWRWIRGLQRASTSSSSSIVQILTGVIGACRGVRWNDIFSHPSLCCDRDLTKLRVF
jgi:hypothetical protein